MIKETVSCHFLPLYFPDTNQRIIDDRIEKYDAYVVLFSN